MGERALAISLLITVMLYAALIQWFGPVATPVTVLNSVLTLEVVAAANDYGLLVSNQGEQLLIDGGGRDATVYWQPTLSKRQLGLDILMLTDDSWQEPRQWQHILRHWPVGMILDTRSWSVSMSSLPLTANDLQEHTTYHRGLAGERFRIGDARMRLLAPTEPPLQEDGIDSPLAQSSGVVLFEWGTRRILHTGTLDRAGEDRLLRLYPELQSDVLIVANADKGTSLSNIFLQHLKPTWVILIGCPPDAALVERVEALELSYIRTDLNGRITLQIENDAISVEQYRREHSCEYY